ncbi:MAG: hypothetical protein ACOC6F_01485 [bacterium]
MNWIPLVVTTLLTPLLTGVVVYLLQLRWQEQMEKRLTRFSRLHERQAEVIAELYARLVQIERSFRNPPTAKHPDPYSQPAQAEREALKKSVEDFWHQYEEHRIYLPEALEQKIEVFYYESWFACEKLLHADVSRMLMSADKDYPSTKQYAQDLDAYRHAVEDIASIKESIEAKFRELLGS